MIRLHEVIIVASVYKPGEMGGYYTHLRVTGVSEFSRESSSVWVPIVSNMPVSMYM